VVAESTINWEWLVYGLQKYGYDVKLAHTLGLKAITWSKKKTDTWDAFMLAKLLRGVSAILGGNEVNTHHR
jgi:transposase